MSEKLDDYKLMELVRDFQIAERDYSLKCNEVTEAKERLRAAQKALGQYLYDVESVTAPSLDGDMILYRVDEDGNFQTVYAGRILKSVGQ